MNYFELFNKVMLELNLTPLSNFENALKSEHLRILENLRRANVEILTKYDWDFMKNQATHELESGENIVAVRHLGTVTRLLCNSCEMRFAPLRGVFTDAEGLSGGEYSIWKDYIILPKSDQKRTVYLEYTSYRFAVDADGSLKANFEAAEDKSILPEPFGDDILVYGATILTKANPKFEKFAFWQKCYNDAVLRLVESEKKSYHKEPCVRLKVRPEC